MHMQTLANGGDSQASTAAGVQTVWSVGAPTQARVWGAGFTRGEGSECLVVKNSEYTDVVRLGTGRAVEVTLQ